MPLARNTSARFDLGRNFANKLWNATRFALSNLAQASPESSSPIRGPGNPEPLTLLDRWMLARLERATRLVDEAIADYEFHRVAEALYDLVWRDFCDWYLEGIKPTIRTNATQQAILASTLDAILRLLHPVCPFVTETLWASVQALVDCVRKVRGERQVSPKRRITLCAPDAVRTLVAAAGGVVETLAGLEKVAPTPATRPTGAVAIPFEGSELLLDGLVDAVDAGAEKSRLSKLIAEREKQASGMRAKLDNEGYVAKAPPSVVEETRKKLAEIDADIAAAKGALASLG
jgi:valyl-tRNA synthetase